MVLNEKLQQDDGAEKSNPKAYISLVGSLIYLINTRTNIGHSITLISKFMNEPSKLHFGAAKGILCYVRI